MSERKLAHIERVISVEPIPSADKIEVATVLGWHCVVGKGEIKPGDLCCYIEIDSVVPPIQYFEFMAPRKYRVKTIKLRGQLSQGLIVPYTGYVEAIKQNDTYDIAISSWLEGTDVTDILGITKYLSPSECGEQELQEKQLRFNTSWIPFHKQLLRYKWYRNITKKRTRQTFPSWLTKTDEERIQNMPWLLKDKQPMVVSEKIDGQSATYWVRKKGWFQGWEFGICSRSMRKSETLSSNWSECARQHGIKARLLSTSKNIAIQGELVCQRVQKGRYVGFTASPYDLLIFNVYDIDKNYYYTVNEIVTFCNQYGLKSVPYLTQSYILPDTIDEIVKYAGGKSVVNPNIEREGIVVRSLNQKISFKVINPNYLLKYED